MKTIKITRIELVQVKNIYDFIMDEEYLTDIREKLFTQYDCTGAEDRINALTVDDIYDIFENEMENDVEIMDGITIALSEAITYIIRENTFYITKPDESEELYCIESWENVEWLEKE